MVPKIHVFNGTSANYRVDNFDPYRTQDLVYPSKTSRFELFELEVPVTS